MGFKPRQMLSSSQQVRSAPVAPPPRPAPPVREEPPESASPAESGPLFSGMPAAEAPAQPPPAAPAAAPQTTAAPWLATGPPPQVEEESIIQCYNGLVAAAQRIFDAGTDNTPLEVDPLVNSIKSALKSFKNGDQLLTEAVRQRSAGQSWAQRAANGAILSMRLGAEIDYDERHNLALGLCALMHDVGMLKVPEEILKSSRLTPQQLETLRNHPNESKKIAEGFGKDLAWTGAIVVQVHERYDGSGYPKGLKGEEIHEFARIIGLADTYEAMAHPRADRAARVVYIALNEIIDMRNKLFDPQLIKSLIRIVSIFPLGSLVKLNNGAVGRVVGANKLYPTRPLVEILLDPRGKKLSSSYLLNLSEEPMLNITDPAIEESVLAK